MSYVEREITILGPGGNSHFNQYPQQWSSQYGNVEYETDPFERLDQARSDRGEYYRRVESTSKNLNIPNPRERRALSPGGQTLLDMVEGDGEVVVREKSISDGGPSADSIPRVPEPHTSWRFYTSYDNGEWRRHAVPVYHSEEDVMNTSPSKIDRQKNESTGDTSSFLREALSPTFGIEASLRRIRVNRPSAYEALQNRRRRTYDNVRRLQGPRSPEIILNTSEYLPPDEVRRRYEVKDYVPKRKTEYGERVIYPRVKSGSTSGIEMESHGMFASHRPRAETNVEEVTRTIHPSSMERPTASSSAVEVLPANSKPINDYGFQEKVIIPTKYKPDMSQGKSNVRVVPDKQSFDEPRKMDARSEQQYLKQSRNQSEYYPTQTTSKVGEVTYARERPGEPSVHRGRAAPAFEPDFRERHFSRSLDDDEFDVRTTRRDERYPKSPSTDQLVTQRSREKSTSQEREVKVVVIKSNPQDKPGSSGLDNKKNRITGYKNERHAEENSRQEPSPKKESKADNLASQVRSRTRDTMKQMENEMFEQMKKKYPEAAEAMVSLISGTDGGDAAMEKKEAFAEQVSLWQGGRPVEEKMNQETRYRTNDPISGPQDFVERSSISKDKDTEGSFFSPFVYQGAPSRAPVQPTKEILYTGGQADKFRGYRDANYRFPDGPGQSTSVFYSSGYPSPARPADARGAYGFFGDGQAFDRYQNHWQQQAQLGQRRGDGFMGGVVHAPLKTTETVDKIIIPTKYQQPQNKDGANERSASVRLSDNTINDAGLQDIRTRQHAADYNPQEGGGFSEYAAYISRQLDASGKSDTIDGTSGTPHSAIKLTSQEVPVKAVQVGRLGSVHEQGSDRGWEFDMAVKEIPRL